MIEFLHLIVVILLVILCTILKLWARNHSTTMAVIAYHLVEIKKRMK